jgi:ABC-type Zn uptake system ZnuABC Zn-binding protein ZnuA
MTSCSPAPPYWAEAKSNQKKILVSFPPLYAITHAVAGDDAYVLSMLTTQGPHDYDYAATDLFKVNKADLFIYNGLTLDDQFVDKLVKNRKNDSLETLNIGAVLEKDHPKLLKKEDHPEDKGAKDQPHDHKHGEYDPHIWLGPKVAIQMTKIIAAKLGQIDSGKKKGYEERADKFIKELVNLEEEGEAAFKDKKNKKLITMHEAFDYFADAFGLDIVETIQKRPGMDPDPASVAKLVKLCREKDGPRVIAVEPQYSKAQAEALKRTLEKDNIHVEIITLDPLETAEVSSPKTFNPDPGYYLKKMRENIDSLAKALP